MEAFPCVLVVLFIPAMIVFAIVKTLKRRSSRAAETAGWYQVDGVKRSDGTDVTMNIEAGSAANAKAKAELQGVVVTSVMRR